jgi:hypothetical protein
MVILFHYKLETAGVKSQIHLFLSMRYESQMQNKEKCYDHTHLMLT